MHIILQMRTIIIGKKLQIRKFILLGKLQLRIIHQKNP